MRVINLAGRAYQLAENVADGIQDRYESAAAGGANFTTGAAAATALTVISSVTVAYALPAVGVYAIVSAPILSRAVVTVTARNITQVSSLFTGHIVGWVSPDLAHGVSDALQGLNHQVFTKVAQANHAGVLGVAAMYCLFPTVAVIPFAGMLVLKMAADYKSGVAHYEAELTQAITDWNLIETREVPLLQSSEELQDQQAFIQAQDAAPPPQDQDDESYVLVERDEAVLVNKLETELTAEQLQALLALASQDRGETMLMWEQEGVMHLAVVMNPQPETVSALELLCSQTQNDATDASDLFYSAMENTLRQEQLQENAVTSDI
jgi:hypothetical protein